MRITYTKNYIRVIGKIWMPSVTAAMEYELTMNELNESARRAPCTARSAG